MGGEGVMVVRESEWFILFLLFHCEFHLGIRVSRHVCSLQR